MALKQNRKAGKKQHQFFYSGGFPTNAKTFTRTQSHSMLYANIINPLLLIFHTWFTVELCPRLQQFTLIRYAQIHADLPLI